MNKTQHKDNFLSREDLVWSARGVMVIVVGNGYGDTNSNPGRADYISYSTNPIILPTAMGK